MPGPALVSPVNLAIGGSPVHLTPVDQDGNPIPMGDNMTIVLDAPTFGAVPFPAGSVNITYDASGAILTAVAPGDGTARWRGVSPGGGAVTVYSDWFLVHVPWNVTAIGDTSP